MDKWFPILKRAARVCVDYLIAQTIFAILLGLVAPPLEDSPIRQACIGGMLVLCSALVAWKSDAQRQRHQQRVKAVNHTSPHADTPGTTIRR